MLKYCSYTCSGSNILENMLERIEKYTKNLEGLVEERTYQLNTEKRKTEKLLHRMLPRYKTNFIALYAEHEIVNIKTLTLNYPRGRELALANYRCP